MEGTGLVTEHTSPYEVVEHTDEDGMISGCVRCIRETGGRERMDPCLETMGGERSSRWSYVGEGRGSFDKLQGYSYVGRGIGDFDREVVNEPLGWRMRKPCLGVVLL